MPTHGFGYHDRCYGIHASRFDSGPDPRFLKPNPPEIGRPKMTPAKLARIKMSKISRRRNRR